MFYTYDELYYEDFTSATREFCYPCWTFTVKIYNFWYSYCVVTTGAHKTVKKHNNNNLMPDARYLISAQAQVSIVQLLAQ